MTLLKEVNEEDCVPPEGREDIYSPPPLLARAGLKMRAEAERIITLVSSFAFLG
jgi:hypothetical protein